MNTLIIHKMLLEEIRLNTSFASGKGFYSFPVLVVLAGLLAVLFSDEIIKDMGYAAFLESCHISILFYGVFTGFLAFFGNDFLERIFGYLGLIIGLPSTQPVSQRRMTLLYFIKEIIFYSIFTLLPALIGALIGAYSNGLDLTSVTIFGLSLFFSFTTGLSFAYLTSSLYRISLPIAVSGGLLSILTYGFMFRNFQITPGLDWYLNGSIEMLFVTIIIPILMSVIATIFVQEGYEPKVMQKIGYKERLAEYTKKFEWTKWMSTPVIVSKERIDLQRSQTGTKMFFSFAFPLGILTFMNWFIDRGLPVQIDFNTIFYGVMIGFFGTMLYSWLNTIDNPNFYSTLPVTVSDVIRARLVLFLTITWWIPLLFMTLIAYMSSEMNLLPMGIVVMIAVGIYIVNYTAWTTGLRTNSALFDAIIFIKFFLVSVPPMIAMTILSLTINHKPSVILIALATICGFLSLMSIFFYNKIETKWKTEAFD
ncbi:MAG: hypothetical protein QGH48_00220 [Candidatus Poseidoniia archaeon]|jgi:hypothetical protein|nr:hypothetical protein [Candidatus Poseidoniia archaeon]MDP6591528.1 hypothetical protein [Candidatus Poseidoniia archaeon]MDP7095894.1 hypothetical protein [Candidatus Poseidoniia archaeon]MDP7187689.1 hypothetical protein [Candidatus Poseidoniia archaeon]MDP7444081.1 hypothetical protein [Candidatus Poseidoniia archaeon]|tara:strand:- start:12738 stop:14174 length:1437 start_codon:yes stop_codon:yes gene_type:complete